MKGLYNTFIRVKIGDLELFTDHDHVMSCSVIKQTTNSSMAKCSLTLYDETALLIEDAILKTKKKNSNFELQYGYVNGKKSDVIHMIVSAYSPQFNQNGSLTVTLEGVPSTIVEASKAHKGKVRAFPNMTPNQIVAQICAENKWVLTDNVPVKPDYHPSRKDQMWHTYKQEVGESDIEFVTKKLCGPEVVSAADPPQGDYIFAVNAAVEPATAFYGPKNLKVDKDKETKDKVAKATYNIGRDNQNILSFSAEYGKNFLGMMGSEKVEIQAVQRYSGEPFDYAKEMGNINTNINIPTLYLAGSAYTHEELQNIAKSVFDKMNNQVFQATLTIVGDPQFALGQYIKLIVLTPQSKIHHTSGMYFIKGVEDTVEMGTYTTRLDLIKNAQGIQNPQDSYKTNSPTAVKGDGTIPGGSNEIWVPQDSGVNVGDCQTETKEALLMLAHWYHSRTNQPLVVTAGVNGDHADGEYSHGNGWKLDVNDTGGGNAHNYIEDPAFLQEFVNYGRSIGLGMNVEDWHGAAGGNFHIDVSVHGDEWAGPQRTNDFGEPVQQESFHEYKLRNGTLVRRIVDMYSK